MIKAGAMVNARATKVLITRSPLQEVETYDLRDAKTDSVLVYPGNAVEFTGEAGSASATGFYFIGGEIVSGGQKDFHQGLTLTQAILASGGIKKSSVRKAILRRKNQLGLLSPLEFDLNAVKAGKQPDPMIKAGDTIEIVN